MNLGLPHSTSMACTVSSSSSRVSGLTVWDRMAVVPGVKLYWWALEERRDGLSRGAHHVANRPLATVAFSLRAPHLPCSHLFMGFVGELSARSILVPSLVITHTSTFPPEPRSPRIPAVTASTSSSWAASSYGEVYV